MDPVLATVMREQLVQVEAAPVADDLADVVEWVGASEVERARALRDVLRLYDTIARSRDPLPVEPPARLPRIPPGAERKASQAGS